MDSYSEKETLHFVVLYLENDSAVCMCESRIERFKIASAQSQGNCKVKKKKC